MEDKFVYEPAAAGYWLECSGAYEGRHIAIDKMHEKGCSCFGTETKAEFSDSEGYLIRWYVFSDKEWLLPYFKKCWTSLLDGEDEDAGRIDRNTRNRFISYMKMIANNCNFASDDGDEPDYYYNRSTLDTVCECLSIMGIGHDFSLDKAELPHIVAVMVDGVWKDM